MMLLSPDGPRSSWLSSPKGLQANSSSCVMSGKISSSLEERSTTDIALGASLCSRTGGGGQHGDASGGDTGGDINSDGEGGGVEEWLKEDEEALDASLLFHCAQVKERVNPRGKRGKVLDE
jgi:hypothetical protein